MTLFFYQLAVRRAIDKANISYLFFLSFNKYLSNVYSVLGTELGPGDTLMDGQELENPYPQILSSI